MGILDGILWMANGRSMKLGYNPAPINAAALPVYNPTGSGLTVTCTPTSCATGDGYNDGKFALRSAGSNYLLTNRVIGLNSGVARSWVFWIRRGSLGQQALLSQYQGVSDYFAVAFTAADKLNILLSLTSPAVAVNIVSTESINSLTTDYCIQVVQNDVGAFYAYYNVGNVMTGMTLTAHSWSANASLTGAVKIGTYNGSYYFNGTMYAVAEYNRDLLLNGIEGQDAQVQSIYDAGPSFGCRRLYANGSFTTPESEAPTVAVGAAYRIGDKARAMALRFRDVYSPSTETFVPVELNLSTLNSGQKTALFGNCAVDGSDIVFADASGTAIKRDIIEFDRSAQTGRIVVRHPSIISGTDAANIYMQWGGTAGSAADPTTYQSVFGGLNYHANYPLNDTTDRTGSYNLSNTGVTFVPDASGYSADFESAEVDRLSSATAGNFENTQAMTISFWCKRESIGANMAAVGRILSTGDFTGWEVSFSSTNTVVFYMINDTSPSNFIQVSFPANSSIDWQKITVKYTGGLAAANVTALYNTVAQTPTVNSNTLTSSILTTAKFSLGSRNEASFWFDGLMRRVSVLLGITTAQQDKLLYDNEDTFVCNGAWDISEAVVIETDPVKGSIAVGVGVGIAF